MIRAFPVYPLVRGIGYHFISVIKLLLLLIFWFLSFLLPLARNNSLLLLARNDGLHVSCDHLCVVSSVVLTGVYTFA